MRNAIISATIIVIMGGLAASAYGQAWTWTGTAGNLWSNTGNWDQGLGTPSAPVSASTTAVVFDGSPASGQLTPADDNAGNFALNGLTFGPSAVSFTLTSNATTMKLAFTTNGATTPTLTQNSASNQLLMTPLVLMNDLTVGGSGTGKVTVGFNTLSGYGNISGAGNLIKNGTFELSLAEKDANALGNTYINNGTVSVTTVTALGSTGTVYLGDPGNTATATLQNLNAAALSFARPILVQGIGTNILQFGNAGSVNNYYSSNITLNQNVIVQGVTTGAGAGGRFTGVISGTGGLTKNQASPTVANGIYLQGAANNTFTGPITVNAGKLFLNMTAGKDAFQGTAITIGTTSEPVAANYANLTLYASNQFNATIPNITINPNGQLDTAGPTAGVVYSNAIGSLTMQGSANVTDLSANAGQGMLTLGGDVTLLYYASNATNPACSVLGNGSPSNNKNTNVLIQLGSVSSRLFTIANSVTTSGYNPSGNGAFDMEILAGLQGSAGITKTGPGLLLLNNGSSITANQSSFTGQVWIKQGTLAVGAPGAGLTVLSGTNGPLGNSSLPILLGDPASANPVTFRVGLNAGTTVQKAITVQGGGVNTIELCNAASTLVGNIVLSNTDLVLSTPAGQTAGNVFLDSNTIAGGTSVISGTGNLIINTHPGFTDGLGSYGMQGNSANTFSGATRVYNGTLMLSKTNNVLSVPGDLAIGDGIGDAGTAVVKLGNAGQIPATSNVVIRADGKLDMNGCNQTFNNDLPIYGPGSVAGSAGTLTLNGNVIGTSSLMSSTSNLQMAIGTASGLTLSLPTAGATIFNISRGAYTGSPYDMVVNATISSPGGLTKQGLGVLQIASAPQYAGTTTVTAGQLWLDGASNLSTVYHVGPGTGAAQSVVLELGATNNLPAGSAVTVNSDGQLTLGATETIPTLTINSGYVSQTGTTRLLTVTTAWNQTAGTINYTGYTLAAGSNGFLSTVDPAFTASASPATIAGKYVLANAAGMTRTFNVPAGGGAADVIVSAYVTDDLGGGSKATNFVKDGPGALLFSGVGAYTGNTTVQAGKFVLTGSLAGPGSLTVQVAGTLAGNGATTLAGMVNNGTIAPGYNGTGVLTVDGTAATLTFSAGSALAININSLADNTKLAVAGAVDLGAGANLALTLPAWPSAGFPVNTAAAYPFPVSGGPTFDVATYGSRVGGSQFATVTASSHWSSDTSAVTYDDLAGKVTVSGAGVLWNVHVGDTDGNGNVNLADLTALATNYGGSGAGIDWSKGDFDCNGLVNLADLTALATVYGATYGGTSAVPEPCTLGLLLLGGLALIRRRKQ